MTEPADSTPIDARGGVRSRWAVNWRTAAPFIAVFLVMAAGLVLISLAHWRRGAVLLGAALALAGALRWTLDDRRIGPLRVRTKGFDVVFYFVAAAGLAVVAIGVGVDPAG